MKLLILLALCGTVALVPVENKPENDTTVTEKPPCATHTPCGWSTYNPVTRQILKTLDNTYCYCPPPLECVYSEDDTAVNGYIRRCRTKEDEIDVSAR